MTPDESSKAVCGSHWSDDIRYWPRVNEVHRAPLGRAAHLSVIGLRALRLTPEGRNGL